MGVPMNLWSLYTHKISHTPSSNQEVNSFKNIKRVRIIELRSTASFGGFCREFSLRIFWTFSCAINIHERIGRSKMIVPACLQKLIRDSENFLNFLQGNPAEHLAGILQEFFRPTKQRPIKSGKFRVFFVRKFVTQKIFETCANFILQMCHPNKK